MRCAAVVVNFNGGADLSACLEALRAQTMPVEVVLVDCASTDGTRSVVQRPPLGVRALPLASNPGYAGGCAAGLEVLRPEVEVIGFFNPDCFPGAEYFAVCEERLLRPGGATLDSCGQLLTRFLMRVRDRGYGARAAGAFERRARVLAACGAGMVYRREALQAAAVAGDVFPAEFFAFWEDLDLGWRVNNAGWHVVYEPRAVATHRRAGTAATGTGRLIFRRPPELAARIVVNRWATLLRNLHAVDFWLRFPVLLPGEVLMLSWLVLRYPRLVAALRAAPARLHLAVRQRCLIPRRRLGELL
jgi:GT2 family glycosyltransferase